MNEARVRQTLQESFLSLLAHLAMMNTSLESTVNPKGLLSLPTGKDIGAGLNCLGKGNG